MSVKIFLCYAREDGALLTKLKAHLKPLERQGIIDTWNDRDISPGADWEEEINKHLSEAHIILLLISPDFMNSDYCYGKEMKYAVERHEKKEACVIPIILDHVHWQVEPLTRFQALPTNAKPVMSKDWHSINEALYDVATNIRKVAEQQDLERRKLQAAAERLKISQMPTEGIEYRTRISKKSPATPEAMNNPQEYDSEDQRLLKISQTPTAGVEYRDPISKKLPAVSEVVEDLQKHSGTNQASPEILEPTTEGIEYRDHISKKLPAVSNPAEDLRKHSGTNQASPEILEPITEGIEYRDHISKKLPAVSDLAEDLQEHPDNDQALPEILESVIKDIEDRNPLSEVLPAAPEVAEDPQEQPGNAQALPETLEPTIKGRNPLSERLPAAPEVVKGPSEKKPFSKFFFRRQKGEQPGSESHELPVHKSEKPGSESHELPVHKSEKPGSESHELPVHKSEKSGSESHESPAKYSGMMAGRVIHGRYLLQRLLKQTAFCMVLQGMDQRLQRSVAVKSVLTPQGMAYRTAIRLTANFSHPYIIGLYDLVVEPESLYVVQEYVEGDTFEKLIQSQLSPYEIVELGWQMCLALMYAGSASRRVCHGDLTPVAVLRDQRGVARINNFALPSDLAYFQHWSVLGGDSVALLETKLPWGQQSEARRADDTRAVGLLLYQLLTGSAYPPPDGRLRFSRGTPPELCELIARAVVRRHPQNITAPEVLYAQLKWLVGTLEPLLPPLAKSQGPENPYTFRLR